MLYKNDELYRLTAQEHKEIRQLYPKFPIKLTYPASRVKPSRLAHNKLPDKPNSISFPFVATVKTKEGSDVWRYAENKIIGTNGKIVWSPHNFFLRGSRWLQAEDIELIYWLVRCCPFLEGGDNWNGKVPKCAIEDLRGEAEKKAAREAEIATMKALIYSPDIGLSEDKLRIIAKAYFIKDVDDLSFPQVKLAVETMVQRDRANGIQNFIDLTKAEITLKIKSSIQQAVDRGIIDYMPNRKMWAWLTEKGLKNEPICQIGAGMNPQEALYEFYLGDKRFAEELESALAGKRVIAVGGEVPGPEQK